MLKVGITGGIGSGKSTVAAIFEALGVPIYYADDRAKKLMTESEALVRAIKQNFGDECYHKNGMLNRKYLASIVFKNSEKLAKLNALVHPAVAEDGAIWMAKKQSAGFSYTLKEAALLFESGSYKSLDKIITVFTPLELRIERLLARDQTTEAKIRDRIANQMPEEEKQNKADFIIYNDGSKLLTTQVLELHKKFNQTDAKV